jgi:hypothetical protein
MAIKKPELEGKMKRALAALERNSPELFKRLVQEYRSHGAQAFHIEKKKAGRRKRAGSEWGIWVDVHHLIKVGNAKNVKEACKRIEEKSGKDIMQVGDKTLKTGGAVRCENGKVTAYPIRSADTLRRAFNAANARYQKDGRFKEDCDFWLEVALEATKKGITREEVFYQITGLDKKPKPSIKQKNRDGK